FPILIGTLLALHLALVASRHHTQFRRKNADGERKVIGIPTFPGQTPKSLGLMVGTAAVLFLLGGLVQINPIWLWGPYEVGLSTKIWVYRALLIAAPVLVTWITHRMCLGLQRADAIEEDRETAEEEAQRAAEAPA